MDIFVFLENEVMIMAEWEFGEGKCKDGVRLSNFGCLQSNNVHESVLGCKKY